MADVKCKICNKLFYVKPSHLKLGYGVYCSRDCQYIGQRKGKFVTCDVCNKEVWKRPKALKSSKSGKFFCSKSCQTKWRNKYFSGELHPNWKTGKHKNYRKILTNSNIKPLCKLCTCNDLRILAVHHKDKDRKNNNVENLIWLCLNCHFLVHRYNKSI